MKLADTEELILGELRLLLDNEIRLEIPAFSGQPGWQKSSDLWEKSKGPIPPYASFTISTAQKDPNVVRRYPIQPPVIKDPASRQSRGGFGIVIQSEPEGTDGDIAVTGIDSWSEWAFWLEKAKSAGLAEIPLEVQY